jgi:hypothetical protein
MITNAGFMNSEGCTEQYRNHHRQRHCKECKRHPPHLPVIQERHPDHHGKCRDHEQRLPFHEVIRVKPDTLSHRRACGE